MVNALATTCLNYLEGGSVWRSAGICFWYIELYVVFHNTELQQKTVIMAPESIVNAVLFFINSVEE